jgi:hypothetical protein
VSTMAVKKWVIIGHQVAKPKATGVQIEADLMNALLGDATIKQ